MRRYTEGFAVGLGVAALISSGGDHQQALAYAKAHAGPLGEPTIAFIKANMAPIGTTTGGESLVPEGTMEFQELIVDDSLLRIPGLIPAPPNATLLEVTSNGHASWVGEAFPKPATAAALKTQGKLPITKVVALVVVTKELERAAANSGVAVITRALTSAGTEAIDRAFIDPSNAGIGGAKPASIAYGAPVVPSSGDTGADIATALAGITHPSGAVVVLNALDAATLATQRDGSGGYLYPDLSVKGGMLAGLPAYVSDFAPRGQLVVFNPQRVFVWQGGLRISYSDQALVLLDDDPSTSSSQPVSLWAANLHGVLVEQATSWLAADNSVVTVALA